MQCGLKNLHLRLENLYFYFWFLKDDAAMKDLQGSHLNIHGK